MFWGDAENPVKSRRFFNFIKPMNYTKKFVAALLFGLVALSFSSCKKEGCTDTYAINYCDECKKDDGTCEYEGEIVFWYDQATSQFLLNDGATSLTFYVDGQVVGSSACNVYWTGSPSCGANGSITVTKKLGPVKVRSYTYKVVDNTGWEYWSGTVDFDATKCTKYQLQ